MHEGAESSAPPHVQALCAVFGASPTSLHSRKLFIQSFEQKRLTGDLVERLQDLELAVGARLADINILGGMVVLGYRNLTPRAVKADLTRFERVAHFIYVKS